MAGYIRLPRDSEENDRRAIGTDSDNNSLRSNMAFLSDYTLSTGSLEPLLRFMGATIATVSLITTAIALSATSNPFAPAALVGCAVGVCTDVPLAAWFLLRYVAKSLAGCEDCKTRIMTQSPAHKTLLLIIDGFIVIWSFITSIGVMAMQPYNWRYHAFSQVTVAGGMTLLVLSLIHCALLAANMTSRVKIEVRFIRVRSGQSTPAQVPFSPHVGSQEARDAPEATPLPASPYADVDTKA